MATATLNLAEVAAQWRSARRIYPVYAAVIAQGEAKLESCRELESPINRSEPEVLNRVWAWFDKADQVIEAFHLRHALQVSHVAGAENLREIVRRLLKQKDRSARTRDKVDYLLVQYYAHGSPEDAHNSHISFEHVAEVLHPVLGDTAGGAPPVEAKLDGMLKELEGCNGLGELLSRRLIERVREVKTEAGEGYFQNAQLVAFTRFNFVFRMGFFRLMHADLHAVRKALHELEQQGRTHADCKSAGLSNREPLAELRQIVREWKKPFRAAYAAANNFKQLVQVRSALETELTRPAAPEPVVAPEPVKKAGEPAVKGVAVPAAPPVPAVAAEAAEGHMSLEQCLEQIAEKLIAMETKSASVSNVMLEGSKLLLASWEVSAFVKGGDDMSDALQRAVAARAVLQIGIDRHKRGGTNGLAEAIAQGHAEAAQIQERIAEAKDAKNIDAAVNLAATAKRLLGQIAEAEKQ